MTFYLIKSHFPGSRGLVPGNGTKIKSGNPGKSRPGKSRDKTLVSPHSVAKKKRKPATSVLHREPIILTSPSPYRDGNSDESARRGKGLGDKQQQLLLGVNDLKALAQVPSSSRLNSDFRTAFFSLDVSRDLLLSEKALRKKRSEAKVNHSSVGGKLFPRYYSSTFYNLHNLLLRNRSS